MLKNLGLIERAENHFFFWDFIPSAALYGGIAKTESDCKYSRLSYQQTHQSAVAEFIVVLKPNRNSLPGAWDFHAKHAKKLLLNLLSILHPRPQ